jgi:gamma-glutamyltranspeptidase/glutathione hydrolase
LLALALLLAACEQPVQTGMIGAVEGFGGAVAADEPRAVLIARDVLSANGTAADAAVALYFALSVTLPSSAGLGGGGICVVHNVNKEDDTSETVALDFLPRAVPGGPVALPGNVRGMAVLHARYGRMRWAQLLSAAESLATLGTPISRALAREVVTAGDILRADPDVARIFTKADGAFLDEGENLYQPQLAAVLSQIRQKGAGEFYTGAIARNIVIGMESLGAPIDIDALRKIVPEFRDPIRGGSGGARIR